MEPFTSKRWADLSEECDDDGVMLLPRLSPHWVCVGHGVWQKAEEGAQERAQKAVEENKRREVAEKDEDEEGKQTPEEKEEV